MTDPTTSKPQDSLREMAESICNLTIGSDYAEVRPGILESVESALRQVHDEAIEKAALVCANPEGMVSRDYTRYAQSTVVPEIRALKLGGKE